MPTGMSISHNAKQKYPTVSVNIRTRYMLGGHILRHHSGRSANWMP